MTKDTEKKPSNKQPKTAPATKHLSKAENRAAKVLKKAVKSAAKIKVRGGEEKKGKSSGGATRKKFKAQGHAPQAARITSAKGPFQKPIGNTRFAPGENNERSWLLVDAAGQTVGRLASEISVLLRGKHKATYTPHSDAGDFVVVINAEKIKFTRGKDENKRYYDHSGWIGGMKITSPAKLRTTYPERILEIAVDGMITRGPLGRDVMKKLKIYRGSEHPHKAQNPSVWQLRSTQTRVG